VSAENSLQISGVLIARDSLRWTPARLPVLEFSIEHLSRQIEAGVEREVSCELTIRALGPIAQQIEVVALGSRMKIEGFVAAKSAKNRSPVLHVRTFELLEGI
jgi:primosomal replication protein N